MVVCLRPENDPNFHQVSISYFEAQLFNKDPSGSELKWLPCADCVLTSHTPYMVSAEPAEQEWSFRFMWGDTTVRQMETCPRSHPIHRKGWNEDLTPGLSTFNHLDCLTCDVSLRRDHVSTTCQWTLGIFCNLGNICGNKVQHPTRIQTEQLFAKQYSWPFGVLVIVFLIFPIALSIISSLRLGKLTCEDWRERPMSYLKALLQNGMRNIHPLPEMNVSNQ